MQVGHVVVDGSRSVDMSVAMSVDMSVDMSVNCGSLEVGALMGADWREVEVADVQVGVSLKMVLAIGTWLVEVTPVGEVVKPCPSPSCPPFCRHVTGLKAMTSPRLAGVTSWLLAAVGVIEVRVGVADCDVCRSKVTFEVVTENVVTPHVTAVIGGDVVRRSGVTGPADRWGSEVRC